MSFSIRFLVPALALGPVLFAHDGHDPFYLDPLVVEGRALDLTGAVASASEGRVGPADLAERPWLRRGELLEVVPGVVVTQHSGAGKANQYFLRGFNLDHGTDFAVSVDGMPVNQRSHGHGQGYADLNFIIPEFVRAVDYRKGAHHASVGDFGSAGSADFELVDSLPRDFVRLEAGENDHLRFVGGATRRAEDGTTTTVGAEAAYQNGPWVNPEHARRFNAIARHAWGDGAPRRSLTVLAYRGEWDATDQIPERAVRAGTLDRFGAVDASDGGDSDRVSLSYEHSNDTPDANARLRLYALRQRLDLYSNFTYATDQTLGDQFNQQDARTVFGGDLARSWVGELGGRRAETTAGVRLQADDIDVGLHQTTARQRHATIRVDEIRQASAAAYADTEIALTDWLRVRPGLRADVHVFDVESDLAANSGRADDAILGPKFSAILGPWSGNELYLNAGEGYHSNDARGITITQDPTAPGTPVPAADPLVRSRSLEVGLRNATWPGYVSTLSVWYLELDSELLYVGDAGGTDAGDPTRRIGVEWTNHYRPVNWLVLDADLALTRARYVDPTGDPGALGRRIPGSVASVASAGALVRFAEGWSASLRTRYHGPRPLIEDGSVEGGSGLTFNARLAWRGRDWEAALSVLNVFDRENDDIVYYYESRLPGEGAAVADRHIHPAEPRTVRLALTRWF